MSFNVDFNNTSEYNISFVVDYGKPSWKFDGNEIDDSDFNYKLKGQFPTGKLFTISPRIFNVESHEDKVLSSFETYYSKDTDSLCLIIGDKTGYASMSKEVILKLIELSQKIEAKSLTFLLCRQNKEFIKFFQGMLTAGFQQNKELSQTIIDGKKYKILTMYMSALDGEIEEIGF